MGNMHRSMQGKVIDMEKLMNQNELMPAIGNVRVNARGDELGPGGKIIRKREDVMAEYYDKTPTSKHNAPIPVEPKAAATPKSVVDTSNPARKGKIADES